MKDCCEVRIDIPERQRRVLQIVLAINAAMFLIDRRFAASDFARLLGVLDALQPAQYARRPMITIVGDDPQERT